MLSQEQSRPLPAVRHRLWAFGLLLDCDRPLPGSTPTTSLPAPPGATSVDGLGRQQLDLLWHEPAEPVHRETFPDGRAGFIVQRTPDHYCLWMSGYGRYLVARRGDRVVYERDGAERAAQERFLFGQALPIAAVLNGYQALHAAAVAVGDRAVAFLGARGAGKTSTAAAMLIRGAALVTDDVLVVRLHDSVPTAYPGPPFMAVRPGDAGAASGALGRQSGSTDKLHFSPPVISRSLRLAGMYFLTRGPTSRIDRLSVLDTRTALGCAFVPYIVTPQRLSEHLALAQQLGSGVAAFCLQTRSGELDSQTLTMLEAHLAVRAA